ncbi:MAG: hypothetical protein WC297_01115 [Candidatus Paceibacterota bacterium]|jgi:hypothetical protein
MFWGKKYVETNGATYKMKKLNPKKVGFAGAIGLNVKENKSFVLWGMVPEGEDDIFEPYPLIEILADSTSLGEWAYGKGQHLKDDVRVSLPSRGLSLLNPDFKIVGQVFSRAIELASDPTCEKHIYWESEKYPNRKYTRPE